MTALKYHHIFVGHKSQLRSPALQAERPMGQLGSRGNIVARGKQKVNFSKIKQGQTLQITKVQGKKYHSERKEKKKKKETKRENNPILKSIIVFVINTIEKQRSSLTRLNS